MRYTLIGSTPLIFILLTTFAVVAAPTKKSYNVSGLTIEELASSLNASGPDGGWGETKNQWSYETKWVIDGDQLKVSKVSVKIETTITMPSWPGYSAASKCMKSSWDKMYKSLQNHEQQHMKIAQGVDDKIKNAILALPPQPSSSTQDDLTALSDATMQPIIETNNTAQDKLDSDTDHGKSDPKDPVTLNSCP
ncbi:DUF922 domain-containing Zn-dependent protease [Mesorhizobium sp. M0954]|uniref:DUF922 domain-containing protein n=1 Tax=Mesorhizobium sp. M0954 TaxID=2957032 RepID=UPI0033395380